VNNTQALDGVQRSAPVSSIPRTVPALLAVDHAPFVG
jgi:hypothetical protein